MPRNVGPSAARNHALRIAQSEYVAILDADDFFLPGRFTRLFAEADWDMIADNIAFVPEASLDKLDELAIPQLPPETRQIDITTFVDANVSRYSLGRTQFGFLKPVIRRQILVDNDLAYDEDVRLGEDFVLYVQLLAAGARFKLVRSCGYVAIERSGSLSASHRVDDLRALLRAEQRMIDLLHLDADEQRSLCRRVAETRRKYALRKLLQLKRERGLGHAVGELARSPRDWYGVIEGVAVDKTRALAALLSQREVKRPQIRLLLS
jgi:succinoglycan biosynthesis protein ExoU